MTTDLTITDLFCGAGGSSIGAVAAGARLVMAANHWDLAIETHNTNFPDAAHDCADISQVDPRRYPSTDILLASPECTYHSMANTTKHRTDHFDPNSKSERSRATMWDIPRFAEQHHYQAVIVENVVEVIKWGLDGDGATFLAWLQTMDSLGYYHKLVSMNSMVAWPTPQSRDRLYVVFWRKKNRAPDLEVRPTCWCPRCDSVVEGRQKFKRDDRIAGKYRQQYLYHCVTCHKVAWPLVSPAASAIDWGIEATRIGDRDRPLAESTRRRIEIGLEKFGPSLVQRSGNTFERKNGYVRAWPVSQPRPTQTTEEHHALVMPVNGAGFGGGARPEHEPLRTQTGRQDVGLLSPGIMVNLRGGGSKNSAASTDDPLTTFTASGTHHGLAVPYLHDLRDGSRPDDAPPDPLLIRDDDAVLPPAFFVKNYGKAEDRTMQHDIGNPLGSMTTRDSTSLVMTYHGRSDTRLALEPLTTQTGKHRHALIEAGHKIKVDDCGFRMLAPEEIGRGMAFPDEYEVLGNKQERVKQYGNAVTPPAMDVLVNRVIESLEGQGVVKTVRRKA